MWVKLICLAVVMLSPQAVASNTNLRTLRTFTMQLCDGEEHRIECWPNTVISISKADYGKPVMGDIQCLEQRDPPSLDILSKPGCQAQDVRERLQTECKEKQECYVKSTPKMLQEDLCPGVQRQLEVAYKCRPNKFFTRVVCENEKMKLRCKKPSRIIIYSAFFGSSIAGAEECPEDAHKYYEDCEVNFATEAAMNNCQGRRRCTLSADSIAFGITGCSTKAKVFLRVVYTCVPKDSLQDIEFQEEADFDYPNVFKEPNVSEILHNLKSEDSINIKFTTPSSYQNVIHKDISDLTIVTTTKKADVQSDETSDDLTDVNCTVADDNQKVVGFLSEWIAAYKFITENKEKFILYVTLSLGVGILLFLLVLTVRLYSQQQQSLKKAKLNISDPLPLGFDEDCSDLDQYDPRQDQSVEVVRYTNMSTIRRQDSTNQPRAPLSHSMNNYYYS
ncbi:protein eva-1 homolog C [Parasteatoda tepidariorum]|uniref:protein eva-1 homolog C n=1 Tax=Parasteatoda tepidariorum TaxID=114398 RepID=UPI00077F9BC4|nr:protein eva-1 homolog C [Parasteatoda tepidariorum]